MKYGEFMKINSIETLMSYFKKREKQIHGISWTFIVMGIIWIISCTIKYKGSLSSFIIPFIIMLCVVIYVIRCYLLSLKGIKYSKDLLNNDSKVIDSEIKVSVQSVDYLYTGTYYMDFKTLNVLKYDDIVLIYKKVLIRTLSFKSGINDCVIVITKSGLKLEVFNHEFNYRKAEYKDTYDLLSKRCKNALEGNTEENTTKINEKYDIDL